MFDRDRFTQDCLDAIKETDSHLAVKELIERACSDPADLLRGLGEPTKAGPDKIYVSDELTILNLVWGLWFPSDRDIGSLVTGCSWWRSHCCGKYVDNSG